MKDRLAPLVSPLHRLWIGLLLMFLFLAVQDLIFKAGFLLILFVLLFLSGKKFRPLPNFLLFFSLVFFQILNPSGEVLGQVGFLIITEEALEKGLMRGMTLVGLIFISLISVRPGLGGKSHSLLARTFYYFSRFMDSRDYLKTGEKRHLFKKLDSLLLQVYRGESSEE
jgi:hypothetical protein